MGLAEAKKYIADLHRKQKDPYLWPNFLTGLPDIGAIIKKIDDIYPKISDHCITYMRIANIHPYLIKYGSNRHAEVIQWAAAILKTTSDKYGAFVGAVNSHDFITVCGKKDADKLSLEASKAFEKKAKSFYTSRDISRKTPLSFIRNGKKVDIGFMQFITSSLEVTGDFPKEDVVPRLAALCAEIEKAGA